MQKLTGMMLEHCWVEAATTRTAAAGTTSVGQRCRAQIGGAGRVLEAECARDRPDDRRIGCVPRPFF